MKRIFLDVETTGLDRKTDEILSISLIDHMGKTPYSSLIRPVRKTEWPAAQAKNGIAPERVLNSLYPTWDEAKPVVMDLLAQYDEIVAYNARFDFGFVEGNLPYPSNWVCCMLRFADFMHQPKTQSWHIGHFRNYKLIEAMKIAGLPWIGDPHGSRADAAACGALWLWLDINAGKKEFDQWRQDRTKHSTPEEINRLIYGDWNHPDQNPFDLPTLPDKLK